MKPVFFILGVQRGGTYSLWKYLIMSGVVTPAISQDAIYIDYNGETHLRFEHGQPIKETGYYGLNHRVFPSSWYDSLFGKNGFEASVEYFTFKDVPERIYKDNPNAKFIVLLRNPVERVWSHYWHEVLFNKSEKLNFKEAIKRKINNIECEYCYSYLSTGHYAEHLKRWFEHFPRENFFITASERLFKNPDRVLKETQDWLNFPISGLSAYTKFNKQDKEVMKEGVSDSLKEYYKPHQEELKELLREDLWEQK